MARLYHVPLSPFCRKVRLSLAEKKIEVELVEERYWEKDADFLRRNPAAKVPVLRLDGMLMAESNAICEYLEESHPTPALLPLRLIVAVPPFQTIVPGASSQIHSLALPLPDTVWSHKKPPAPSMWNIYDGLPSACFILLHIWYVPVVGISTVFVTRPKSVAGEQFVCACA